MALDHRALVPCRAMSKRKPARSTAAKPDLDPAALALQKTYERLRKLASRALLRRRRRKSGQ
jgi:hypothetical protein